MMKTMLAVFTVAVAVDPANVSKHAGAAPAAPMPCVNSPLNQTNETWTVNTTNLTESMPNLAASANITTSKSEVPRPSKTFLRALSRAGTTCMELGGCDMTGCTENCNCMSGHCNMPDCTENCNCVGGSCAMPKCQGDKCTCVGGNCCYTEGCTPPSSGSGGDINITNSATSSVVAGLLLGVVVVHF